MEEFNIELGINEQYTLKNFTFDINNNGSADLQIDAISANDNVIMPYIKTPFIIVKDSNFQMFGFVKILPKEEGAEPDYIDFSVSWIDSNGDTQTDSHRYWLLYDSIIPTGYTQLLTTRDITYIKSVLLIYIDSDEIITDPPKILLHSVDNNELNLFPSVYRISDKKIVYAYRDNKIKNLIINDGIKMFILNKTAQIEINRLSHRVV